MADKPTRDRQHSSPHGEFVKLFAALARGEFSVLDRLYEISAGEIYGLGLWRTGNPEDAEEVVQEVFVRIARQGEELAKIDQPRGWLLTVARRIAIDLVRRRERRKTEPMPDTCFLESTGEDPGRRLDARRASRLLANLPSSQREVIYLHEYCDLSFSQIGKILALPTFTAASRYRLGMKKLRQAMESPS